jgi:hypothetical protein
MEAKLKEMIEKKHQDVKDQVKAFNDVGDCNWWHNFWGDCSKA